MRTLLCAILCALASAAWAQTFDAAEYFWDTDPGGGLGTTFVSGFDRLTLTMGAASASTLPTGTHTLNVRFLANGIWSVPRQQDVYIAPAVPTESEAVLTHAERFWDDGAGGVTTIPFTPSGATQYLFDDTGVSSLIGEHLLKTRFAFTVGGVELWTPPMARKVNVGPAMQADPVIGNEKVFFDDVSLGAPNVNLTAEDGAYDDPEETGSLQISHQFFAIGDHDAYARAIDAEGHRSPVVVNSFNNTYVLELDFAVQHLSGPPPALRLTWLPLWGATGYLVCWDTDPMGTYSNCYPPVLSSVTYLEIPIPEERQYFIVRGYVGEPPPPLAASPSSRGSEKAETN